MIRSHMCGKQTPVFVTADPMDGLKGGLALIRVHLVRRLFECPLHVLVKFGTRLRWPGARHIVVAVDGALLAGKVRSVTGKRDEVGGYAISVGGEGRFSRTFSHLSAPGRSRFPIKKAAAG
jgi:hypothetical protein